MSEFDVSKIRKMVTEKQCTIEQAFEKCWIYLQNFVYTHSSNATIHCSLIESLENSFNGFKNYLISKNYALNESQFPQTLTELRMKKLEIQDEEYNRICNELNSAIYITHITGKKPKQRMIKEPSPILLASLCVKTDDPHFMHFINIFKNSIFHNVTWPSTFDEYTIPSKIFESFAALFPEYIEILKELSSELYVKLYNQKAPYDKKLKEVEMQIQQKVKEIIQNRISYIILPNGERLKVLYDD